MTIFIKKQKINFNSQAGRQTDIKVYSTIHLNKNQNQTDKKKDQMQSSHFSSIK